mgnify:CR=1 FL=1
MWTLDNDPRSSNERKSCTIKQIGIWVGFFVLYFVVAGLFSLAGFTPGYLIILGVFYAARKCSKMEKENSISIARDRIRNEAWERIKRARNTEKPLT